jgi:succinoglycan biosynthesis transport protein ExoP
LQSETTTSLYQQRQSLASDLANKQGPEAAGLREQLAQLDARIESDGKTELTNLQDAVTSGASEIADLKTQLRSLAVTGGMPALLVTNLYALQQNAQLARSQYQSLLSRQQQLVVEATLQLADSRLVSPALPPSSPVWPNWHLSLTLGSLAGFALAVGSALLRDSFVGGFTSLDHLEAVLGTPALASILWRRKSRHHLDAFSIADLMRLAPLSTYAESIRKLQVGVTHALRRVHERTSSAARGGVVLVSSVAPGDGKTTIALSLARAFAASGHSTLLIDGDLRLPRLHQHLGIEPAAGLGELLQGSGAGPKLPEILITDPMADLRVIVGANRSDSPTDRLLRWAKTSQPAAKAAITALREAMPTGSEIVSVINQQRTSPPQSDYDREYQG